MVGHPGTAPGISSSQAKRITFFLVPGKEKIGEAGFEPAHGPHLGLIQLIRLRCYRYTTLPKIFKKIIKEQINQFANPI